MLVCGDTVAVYVTIVEKNKHVKLLGQNRMPILVWNAMRCIISMQARFIL